MKEWTKCSERLPELKDDSVLAYFSEEESVGLVHIHDYFQDITSGIVDGVQTYTKWYKTRKVTHWMPLPDAPTESEKCKGFELDEGVYSGCDQSAGDCPVCGK